MNEYYEKFLLFIKKHNLYDEKKFNYLISNATLIDVKEEDNASFIGCYYTKNEYNLLTKIKLYIPRFNDDTCVMIAIHEYVHGYIIYDRINKFYQSKAFEEVLPMFYEYLYYLEEKNQELEEYRRQTIEYVQKEAKTKYILGLKMQEELLNVYDYNIKKISTDVKKKSPSLIKKIKKEKALEK